LRHDKLSALMSSTRLLTILANLCILIGWLKM